MRVIFNFEPIFPVDNPDCFEDWAITETIEMGTLDFNSAIEMAGKQFKWPDLSRFWLESVIIKN